MARPQYPSIAPGTHSVKLNTGADVPLLGLGTWRAAPEVVSNAVEVALRHGVRHIDAAFAYGNEESVGEGIRASGVPRDQIFVTTKLWCTFHRRVQEGLERSLQALKLDHIDLYLVHWPIAMEIRGEEKMPMNADGSRAVDHERALADTWSDMEALVDTGKVRAIGVSNVSQAKMEQLLKTTRIVPACNQIESHPFLPEHELVLYLQSKGIVPAAYSPLGSGAAPVLEDETIVSIAKAKQVDPAQVVIAWQAQRGVVVIPKSVTEKRIISNAKLITLTQEEMDRINTIYQQPSKHVRTCMPKWNVDLQFPYWPDQQ